MRLWGARVAVVVTTWLLALSMVSCIGDPGSELTLQIYNATSRTIRVTVTEMADVRQPPPAEVVAVEATLSPGEMKDAKIVLGHGAKAGPVRAYSDRALVFCQNYDYQTGPRERVTRRVDIVEGQVNCQ